jgi:1,2-phenylacetyl-CoA epoxidase PaaB subunit
MKVAKLRRGRLMDNTFEIAIEEVNTKQFTVTAPDAETAMEIAKQKYHAGEFVLDPGKVEWKKIAIIGPDDPTEFIEF